MVIRCAECLMRSGDCLCEDIPTLATTTRIVVVLHHSELFRPSNTGRLAAKALSNSEVRVHGSQQHPPAGKDLLLDSQYDSYVLFPTEGAVELTSLLSVPRTKPLKIIVPDGTWSQASRISRRVPELSRLPRLALPVGLPSSYVLRRNQNPGRVCTLEAIAALLGAIESPEIEKSLRHLLDLMVARTLKWKRSPDRAQRYEELLRLRAADKEQCHDSEEES